MPPGSGAGWACGVIFLLLGCPGTRRVSGGQGLPPPGLCHVCRTGSALAYLSGVWRSCGHLGTGEWEDELYGSDPVLDMDECVFPRKHQFARVLFSVLMPHVK